MDLTAVFESWHIGDGNCPPLNRGQFVKLSFELEPEKIEETTWDAPESLEHVGNGEYRFCGRALKLYRTADRVKLTVMQTGEFRFYIMGNDSDHWVEGRRYCGVGTLLLDHYSWVENLAKYENPPDLFYKLRVKRILKVNIPDKFVSRHEKGKSLPTRLKPDDYSNSDTEELEGMLGQPFDEEFYIIDFDGSGLEEQEIPRTFMS